MWRAEVQLATAAGTVLPAHRLERSCSSKHEAVMWTMRAAVLIMETGERAIPELARDGWTIVAKTYRLLISKPKRGAATRGE